MKRLALVAFAVALFAPATAHAAVPCRDRIYNDWYPDGKIATTYPISCYRDALKHMKQDERVYSSLGDDIRSAMQAALQRKAGKHVPESVGKGGSVHVSPAVTTLPRSQHDGGSTTTKTDAGGGNQSVDQTTTIAAAPTSSKGGGIPTPILVLGGLALVLVAAGAIGAGAKRFKRPPTA